MRTFAGQTRLAQDGSLKTFGRIVAVQAVRVKQNCKAAGRKTPDGLPVDSKNGARQFPLFGERAFFLKCINKFKANAVKCARRKKLNLT